MNVSVFRRAAVRASIAGVTTVLLALSVAPAQAGSMFFSKSSGRVASADWLEVGTLPGGVPGNIHFGSMQVEDLGKGEANVWGIVFDMTCPDGFIPEGPGGGHGEKPEPNGCTDAGVRIMKGGDVTFTMDRKFKTARLTGTLNMVGHDGGTVGAPPANMTWTGIGDSYRSVESGRYDDDRSSGSYRYSFSGRDAEVTGAIGAMVFDDVEGEYSTAQLGSFRSVSRDRTR